MTPTLIHLTPLDQLRPSPFPAQAERRAHYDPTKLKELADNIKAVGIAQPIVARQVNGHFEIIAGERRWLAAKAAGLAEVPVWVRDLNDQQALEIQLVENLQREGLHELAEAEGYERLMKDHGYDVEQLVAKVGKSRSYVYARLKLCALCPDGRKSFYSGKISASIALLIARIPVEGLQRQALKEVLEESQDNFEGPMSYREAAEYIQQTYMLRLKEAPFPVGDAQLVPAAGACISCPKNTAMQRELFADVEHASAGVCTDPVCFKAKRDAWGRRQLDEAKTTGRKIIDGGEAKKIAKHPHSLQGGYVKLNDRCYDDRNHRTYREILGKKAESVLLRVPETGDVIEVVQKKDVADLLPKQASSSSATNTRFHEEQRKREQKRKSEEAFRLELLKEIRERSPATLSRGDLNAIAEAAYNGIGYEAQKRLIRLWDWTDKADKAIDPYQMRGKRIREEIAAHTDAQLRDFLLDCAFAGELVMDPYARNEKPDLLLAAAKRLKIDADKLRKELAAAQSAKAKPAPAKAPKKAGKKKAARKPK